MNHSNPIWPPFLSPGDTIGIVAPARKVVPEQLEKGIKLIENAGFKVKLASNIGLENGQFAGSDEERAEGINAFILDDEVKAMMAARGGYGSIRTIQHIQWENWKARPKWFCGFSDVTVIHEALSSKLNMISLHAPVLTTLELGSEACQKHFFDSLKMKTTCFPEHQHLVKGRTFGGNLSMIYSLTGTDLLSKGDVLFIEDLDEMLYHLDRMLMNLEYSGVFNGVKTIALGSFSDFKDNTLEFGFSTDNPYGKTAKEILEERLEKLGMKVIYDLPFGHQKENWAWYHGEMY
ncbi:MAG: LD-carboxypeptidase [Flavobacteriales bacterium]|nr:LD-carboxypeptidase [Flavobacteriales bacterium]MDG1767100.1 LD-carboxypeptidase [Flavobacteriales bacterium]